MKIQRRKRNSDSVTQKM